MAVQAIGWFAAARGLAGQAVGTVIISGASHVAGSLAGGVAREVAYAANRIAPNNYPDFPACIDLYWRGYMDFDGLAWFGRAHGVEITKGRDGDWPDVVWARMVEAARPDFTVDQAITFLRAFDINRDDARKILTNNGFKDEERQNLILDYSEVLDVGTTVQLWRQGVLSEANVRGALIRSGIIRTGYQDAFLQLSTPVGPEVADNLAYRGKISNDQWDRYWARAGIVTPEDRRAWSWAVQDVPGPSDLVRFAVREVWNREVVQQFGFDEEFETIPEFSWWMNAQGMYGSPVPHDNTNNRYLAAGREPLPPTGEDVPRAEGDLDSWARAYWRAHWDLPSPTQGYEFLHRLRPNRMARYRETVPDVQPFVFADLALLLKTADYPKPFRDRLAAISYRTITRVDLRRLYDQGIIDEAEVQEQNLDAGYAPADARFLTEFIVRERRQRRLKKVRDRELKRQERLYRSGLTTQAQYAAALQAAGVGAQEATATAASVALDLREEMALAAVKSIRTLYTHWEIDDSDARQRLSRLGMPNEGIDRTLQLWALDRETRGRRVTASQIGRWVVRGVLSAGSAVRRLVAMGYTYPDAMKIIQVAQQDRDLVEARAQQAAARSEGQRARAQEAELRASQRQTAQIQRQMAQRGSPSLLARWFKKGLVKRQEAFDRLIRLGWTVADADRWLDAAVPPSRPTPPPPPPNQMQGVPQP